MSAMCVFVTLALLSVHILSLMIQRKEKNTALMQSVVENDNIIVNMVTETTTKSQFIWDLL